MGLGFWVFQVLGKNVLQFGSLGFEKIPYFQVWVIRFEKPNPALILERDYLPNTSTSLSFPSHGNNGGMRL